MMALMNIYIISNGDGENGDNCYDPPLRVCEIVCLLYFCLRSAILMYCIVID